MSTTPIGSLLGLSVKPKTSKMIQPPSLPSIDSNAIIGIEVEVEQFAIKTNPVSLWQAKEDGSLRNTGMEYVSSPIEANLAPALLHNLLVSSLEDSCSFSLRTSIHIHLNALDMTLEQMQAFVLLYTVYEDVFYRYAGRGRQKNIYCVPISETYLLTYLLEREFQLKWEKYTGLNLCRLSDLGTLEFRHLAGTNSPEKIINWIALICRLRDYVIKSEGKTLLKMLSDLDESSDYLGLLEEIFGPYMVHVKTFDPIKYYEASLVVKTAFLKRSESSNFRAMLSKDSPFYKIYRTVAA